MPSNRRLRFTPDADADFESLLQYTVQTWGEPQMHAYAETIYGVLDELGTFPGIANHEMISFPGH
jgi:plasmid stabilization system protein ParE